MSAAILSLLEMSESLESGNQFDLSAPRKKVLGIDIEIRPHNRLAIESHPMWNRIEMIEGPSTSREVSNQVKEFSQGFSRVMVFLDSNHNHNHVLEELKIYAPLTSIGSYCAMSDKIAEDLLSEMLPKRAWRPGNNPKTAVREFLKSQGKFEIVGRIDDKLAISGAPEGNLRRVG